MGGGWEAERLDGCLVVLMMVLMLMLVFGRGIGHWYQDEYFHVKEGYVSQCVTISSFLSLGGALVPFV